MVFSAGQRCVEETDIEIVGIVLRVSCGKVFSSRFSGIALTMDENAKIIKLNGSVELAPLVGLSEVIVDVVETGKTLRENGLIILDEIADISARLIVNRVSLKMKSERIKALIEGIKKQL